MTCGTADQLTSVMEHEVAMVLTSWSQCGDEASHGLRGVEAGKSLSWRKTVPGWTTMHCHLVTGVHAYRLRADWCCGLDAASRKGQTGMGNLETSAGGEGKRCRR